MEFSLLLVVLSLIPVMQLRLRLVGGKRRALPAVLYICAVCVLVLLLEHSLSGVSQNIAEEQLTTGIEPGAIGQWLRRVNHALVIYFPLPVLLAAFFIALELCVAIARRFRHLHQGRGASPGARLLRHAGANLVAFLLVPALAFWIAGSDGNRETARRDFTDAAYNLTPVLALYGAPAYWLGVRSAPPTPMPDALPWSPLYAPTRIVTMNDFALDSLPWIALSLVLAVTTLLATRGRSGAPAETESLRTLLLGEARALRLRWRERIRALPWRGRYMLVWLAGISLLVAFGWLLTGLLYGFIALFYSGAIYLLVLLPVLFFCWLRARRG